MRYLGNKAKLLINIENFIEKNKIKGKTFFDLFSGTGTVAEHFKDKYDVSSNDYMYFSFIIQSSKLLNNKIPSFRKLNAFLGEDVFVFLNKVIIDEIKDGYFISQNYSNINSERKYFSTENGYLIDFARQSIEE